MSISYQNTPTVHSKYMYLYKPLHSYLDTENRCSLEVEGNLLNSSSLQICFLCSNDIVVFDLFHKSLNTRPMRTTNSIHHQLKSKVSFKSLQDYSLIFFCFRYMHCVIR